MNTIVKTLASVVLLMFVDVTYADLTIDKKYDGAKQNIDKMSWDEQVALDGFFKRWDKHLLQAIADDNSGVAPNHTSDGLNSGHILWNGKNYYAWAVHYWSAAQDHEYDAAIANKRKSVALPGGGVCALYVHDQNLNKLASLKIDLPENNHGTWCNGIDGMGGAGKTVDGVLVSLSYYLAGKKPAQRAEDIGKGWRYMTVLIRFEEQNGKLVLKQDDSCFGNPNQITDIPSARKALARCSAQAK